MKKTAAVFIPAEIEHSLQASILWDSSDLLFHLRRLGMDKAFRVTTILRRGTWMANGSVFCSLRCTHRP